MEYKQLESRIAFLDNQYRREREDIAQLHHRLEVSEASKDELLRRIEALENALISLKSELPKIGLIENRTELFKSEIKKSLDDQKERQKQALRDSERARAIELDSQTKVINDLRREIQRARDLDEMIALSRSETERQATAIAGLNKRIDEFIHHTEERMHPITYLLEQRRADAQKIGDLQSEAASLHNQIALQVSKIESVEEQIPKFGPFQAALEQLREKVQAEVEQFHYQQAKIERETKNWSELSNNVQHRLDEYGQRLDRYAEHYQRNIKVLESLQEFQERIQREQHQFTELQRLNSDRLRSQTEAWESMQEQAINKYYNQTERRLAEMNRVIEQIQKTIDETAVQIEPLKDQFTMLLRIMEEDALARAVTTRDWQVRFEQLATEEDV